MWQPDLDALTKLAGVAVTRAKSCTPEYSAMRGAQEAFRATFGPSEFLWLMEQRNVARRETIVAAAIRIPVPDDYRSREWGDRRLYPDFLIISAPPPARHSTLLHPSFDLIGHGTGLADQGFLTSAGRYVDREEALKIALASGQPMIDHPSRSAHQLFSEDLW